MDLVGVVYGLTRSFPPQERYGLVQQVRRAAVSIPSNIAEGCGREHLGDDLRHLSIARGSLAELETQLSISERMGYILRGEEGQGLALAGEVGRMLSGLLRALKRRHRVQHLTPST